MSINDNIFWELKELDMSYNHASKNYLKDKFKDTMIEDMLEERAIINQGNIYFSLIFSA